MNKRTAGRLETVRIISIVVLGSFSRPSSYTPVDPENAGEMISNYKA